MSPKVTVAIPARNAQDTLEVSVKSVLCQDYENIEVVIAVNGSSDRTLEISKNLSKLDKRISVIESSPGIVPALNACLKVSTGKYIARQDADDEWLPGKLNNQISRLEREKIDVLGTQMTIRSQSGDTTTRYPLTHEGCLEWLSRGHNPIGHPSVVFRSSLLEKVGGYWELFPLAEDLDLWMRCLPHVRFSNLEEVGNIYNFRPNPNYNPAITRAIVSHYSNLYSPQRA
jgi:glycosyltransferase involved in cell wall biosynthesis